MKYNIHSWVAGKIGTSDNTGHLKIKVIIKVQSEIDNVTLFISNSSIFKLITKNARCHMKMGCCTTWFIELQLGILYYRMLLNKLKMFI